MSLASLSTGKLKRKGLESQERTGWLKITHLAPAFKEAPCPTRQRLPCAGKPTARMLNTILPRTSLPHLAWHVKLLILPELFQDREKGAVPIAAG